MSTHAAFVRSALAVVSAVGLEGGAALAKARPTPAKVAKSPDDLVDISAFRDKLRVYTDGKQHYFVLVPFEFSGQTFFYGDGKDLYAQRPFGGGRSGDQAFNRSFWDPRVESRGQSMFQLANKTYTITCGARETVLQALPEAEGQALIKRARFHRPLWKRQSYWLARDEKARYYFVDRMREPEGNKSFRLFVGPKGALKQQKMTNVVSDQKGDVFSTKGGQLRLLASTSEGAWVQGKTRTPLKAVPIEDNHVLVYTDLGVYTGEKLGTPCDDL